ncbi:MAG: sulfatase-like hydrolase/transferase [bacterium]
MVVVLAVLLWPLSSGDWEIDFDDEAIRAKEEFLAGERRRRGRDPGQRAPSDGRPNVVLILADDLAQQDLGIYGHPVVETPHIDSLGREGVVFTQATATTSICAPSRAALLTGRHQQRFGFEYQPHTRYPRNRLEYLVFRHLIDTSPMVPKPPAPTPRRRDIENQGLPPSEVTLAEVLKARGYRTAAIGKWHLGYNREQFSPLHFGFDDHYGFYEAFSLYAPIDDPDVVNVRIDDFSDKHMWSVGRKGHAAIVHNDEVVTEEDYLTDVFADRAVRFIRDSAAARDPFFLYLPFSAPHTPLQAPREYWDRYAHVDNEVHRAYYAMISSLDDAVGRILTTLEETGAADDTLVIFTGDNGGVNYMGISDNGSLAGGKFSTFRGGLVVPMIMTFPGRIPAGSTFDHPVSLLDVTPTVAAVTGGAVETAPGGAPGGASGGEWPAPLDGVNLLPYVGGAPQVGEGALGAPHETLYWRSGYNLAVRRGEWKLYRDRRNDITRLYDLGSDPGETTDLSTAHPGKVAELEDALAVWEAGLAPKAWPRVMDVFMDIHGFRYWFGI